MWLFVCFCQPQGNDGRPSDGSGDNRESMDVMEVIAQRQRRREASLVQLLAGLAVSNTYQAGMYPPGGVWQDGDKAGDPILQTTNPGRYGAFYYCNSAAFVASLLAIFLGQKGFLIKYHALQAAMILDLLSLIVAYAIGSCRDQNSSMYVLGIAAAAVVYVVVHIQYFTLGSSGAATTTDEDDAAMVDKKDKDAAISEMVVDKKDKDAAISEMVVDKKDKDAAISYMVVDKKDKDAAISDMVVDKRGGRFLVFAILVASITYQAGLTPPGGFLLQDDIQSGHRAGDLVLLYNYPRRYKAFFYFNSVSFMVSTILLLLLMNPNLYRPAIRSHALSLCSAVSFICLIGAFAAGSTQHLKTSFYFFVFAAVGFFLCLPLLLTIYSYLPSVDPGDVQTMETKDDDPSRKKIYLMTLAILVGSATYQAGLDPPGGSWQSTSDAGHPVMRDHRRNRYLAFLCGNTTSFVASIYLIELLLFSMVFEHSRWLNMAIGPTVVLQYLGFLVAYTAGSSRQWKTSWHVGALVIAVLAFVTTHVMLSYCRMKTR